MKKKNIFIIMVFLLMVNSDAVHADEIWGYSEDEHVYTDWTVTTAPTCTTGGERYKECLLHGGKVIEELPAAGHQYQLTEVEPTCTQAGVHRYTCSKCGHQYEEEYGEALDHDFVPAVTREADCEHAGEQTFTCTRCDEQYTEGIPELGHEYGEWIVERAAEPGSSGRKYQECKNCNRKIYQTITALAAAAEEPEPLIGFQEVVLMSVDVGILAAFAFFIRPDIILILWNRKKRREYELKQQRERIDNCGFS